MRLAGRERGEGKRVRPGLIEMRGGKTNMTYLTAVAQIVHTMRRQLLLASPVRLTRAPVRRQLAANGGRTNGFTGQRAHSPRKRR